MSEDEQQKADMAMVQKVLDSLGEHFDTVQVFVTRYEPNKDGGTMNLHMGVGNWFARFGQVKEWFIKRDENSRIDCRHDSP